MDKLESQGGLEANLAARKVTLRNALDDISKKEEISWRQKSRIKWVTEGDVNSNFFHKVVNGKRRRSFIKELELDDGTIIKNNEAISDEVTSILRRCMRGR